MAQNKHAEAQDPEQAIESAINKTEAFIFDNGKSLLTALAVILVVVGGFFGYKYLYAQPRANKAADMMFVAEQQFAADSFALALNGDGNNDGFLEVIARYGNTPQGNIAQHYAGICYLRMGDFEQAAVHLAKYKARKGAPAQLLNAQNIGLQGDIKAEQGAMAEAVKLYVKAVEASDNNFTAPYYLKKAGMAYEALGDKAAALVQYNRIRDEFAMSLEARDIEKYIGRAE